MTRFVILGGNSDIGLAFLGPNNIVLFKCRFTRRAALALASSLLHVLGLEYPLTAQK